MQRYFASIINNEVKLSDGDVHHFLHVMRAKPNDLIEVVDNSSLYLCKAISVSPLKIIVQEPIKQDVELKKDLTLFFALSKGEKIEFVLQKATEIGAKRIVLLKTKRSVVKLTDEDFKRKLPRYQTIVKEASEQSHRLVIPEIIGVVDINKIPSSLLADINYIAYEDVKNDKPDLSIPESCKSVSICIGSEGGFESIEVEALKSIGFKTVSLGKRILRAETAAVYSLSVISYLLEQ